MNKSEPLPCEDPKFPPLQVRNLVLHSVKESGLLAWVEHLGGRAKNKDEAVEFILRREFGDERIDEFIARMKEAATAHAIRLSEAKRREKEATAKFEKARGMVSVDLEADAAEKRAQRSGPPANPLSFRGPLPEEK